MAGDSWASPLWTALRRTTGFSIPRIRRRHAFLWIGHSRHPLSGIQHFACSDIGEDSTRGFPLKTAGMTEGEDGTARRGRREDQKGGGKDRRGRGTARRGRGTARRGRENTSKALFRSFPTSFIGNPGFCLFRRRRRYYLWIPAKNCGNDRGGRRDGQKGEAGRPERGRERQKGARDGQKGARDGQKGAREYKQGSLSVIPDILYRESRILFVPTSAKILPVDSR